MKSDTHRASIEKAIHRRAYELWQQRGCPEGSPEVDWLAAEAELARSTQGSKRRSKTRARRIRASSSHAPHLLAALVSARATG